MVDDIFGNQANSYPTVASGQNIADISTYMHVDTGQDDEDQTVEISSVFTDTDSGATLVITASSSDATHVSVKSVTSSSLVLTVKAGTDTNDAADITITANDGKGGIVSDTFTVTLQ